MLWHSKVLSVIVWRRSSSRLEEGMKVAGRKIVTCCHTPFGRGVWDVNNYRVMWGHWRGFSFLEGPSAVIQSIGFVGQDPLEEIMLYWSSIGMRGNFGLEGKSDHRPHRHCYYSWVAKWPNWILSSRVIPVWYILWRWRKIQNFPSQYTLLHITRLNPANLSWSHL